jgi:hypothetical protein
MDVVQTKKERGRLWMKNPTTKRWLLVGNKTFFKLGFDKKYPHLLNPPAVWKIVYSKTTHMITLTDTMNNKSFTEPINLLYERIPTTHREPPMDCILMNSQSETIFTKEQVQYVVDQYKKARIWKIRYIDNIRMMIFSSSYMEIEFFSIDYLYTHIEYFTANYNLNKDQVEFIKMKYNQRPKIQTTESLLEKLNIRSRSDFRKWSVKNHPDKGGDTATFQDVNNAVSKAFP